ncbi:uncharacterized protein BDW70DRAFT_158462 [Aspergillus foveolatus]|uniref:uncharacterized protein n=1 Tax=Aspergillus foveolatus TaxID=210207 RepID=UPI003CCDFAA7
MYNFERRAIFSKKWMLVSHRLRFTEPGSYLQLQEGGFSFFLILDRQGKINGFHNNCRHRAYPLVEEDAGSVKIPACKLVVRIERQARQSPSIPGTGRLWQRENGLFPIHIHIDKLGFIWVNLDAAETPCVRWEEGFAGVDEQPRLKPFDFSQYRFDHAWDMMGDYNWKTLADNYNEVGWSTISAKRWLMISAITVRLAIPVSCNIPIFENTGWKPRLGISNITTQIDQIMRAWE